MTAFYYALILSLGTSNKTFGKQTWNSFYTLKQFILRIIICTLIFIPGLRCAKLSCLWNAVAETFIRMTERERKYWWLHFVRIHIAGYVSVDFVTQCSSVIGVRTNVLSTNVVLLSWNVYQTFRRYMKFLLHHIFYSWRVTDRVRNTIRFSFGCIYPFDGCQCEIFKRSNRFWFWK